MYGYAHALHGRIHPKQSEQLISLQFLSLGAYVVLFAPLLDGQSARPTGLYLLAPLSQLGSVLHCPDIHSLPRLSV